MLKNLWRNPKKFKIQNSKLSNRTAGVMGLAAQRRRLDDDPGPWEMDLTRRELRTHGIPVPLGGRAFDIVEVLARSAGELVTKDEIMRQVWSGAVVEESALQVHISAIRKALGPDRGLLKTAFGRGYRLL